MIARMQGVEIGPRRRRVQEAQAARYPRQLETLAQGFRQCFGQIANIQRLADQLLQRRIGQSCGRRVNRGHFCRQRLILRYLAEARMHHLQPEKAAAHFAKNPNARTNRQRRLLARVEAKKTERDLATRVAGLDQHLPARPILDFVGVHHDFQLYGFAAESPGNWRDARFVLVAQRQMRQQIGLAMEADFGKFLPQRLGGANRDRLSQAPSPHRPRPTRRAAVP